MRQISLIDFAPLTGTDWTASLKEAIAYLKARYGGGVLVVPGGTYKISDTITISQVRGLEIRGEGSITTDFEWAGVPTLPMFTFNRTQGCYLENVSITAKPSFPLLEGVRIQQGANDAADPHHPGLPSSLMTVRDMIFRGQGALGVGVRVFLFDALNDDKNDFHRFYNLQISGCTWAGLVLEGRNAKEIGLYHVDVVSAASGIYPKYGVLTLANFCPGDPGFNEGLALAAPLYNHGASFSWFGGAAMGCSRSNLMLGDHNDAILVAHVYSEKSGRWLHVPAYPSGVAGMAKAFPVTLDSCRYGTAGVNPNLPADGELVIFQADGPLTIRGCPWGDRISGEQLRVRVESHIKPGTFVFQGNSISNDGDGNVFVAEMPSNADYQVTNRGYREGSLARLGAGVTIPTDGPSSWYYPETSAQWGMVDGTGTAPAPDSQWLTSVAATGAVADIIGSYPLIAEGTLEYQQELTPSFTKTGIHFAEVSGEKLTPNTNDYNPATDSVAWKVDAKITTSGGSRVVIAMGNGGQTAGGGAIQLKIRSDGKAEIFVGGSVRATGSFTYEGSGSVHRFLFVLDRDQGATTPRPTVYLFTDQETISVDVSGMTITNNSRKCIGANNGLPPDCIVLDPAVWEGQDKIDVILTTAWRSAMSVVSTAIDAVDTTVFLTNFAPLSGDDWYIPLNNALAYLTAQGGGRLVVPQRVASYDCTVTAAVQITSNDITIELDAGAVLQNISGSGVDFFQFAGTAGTRNRVNFRGGKILSGVSAGRVFTFAPDVGLGFANWDVGIQQLNPDKEIIYFAPPPPLTPPPPGLFTNRFGGWNWEHGSGKIPGPGSPSVSAVTIRTAANSFNDNCFSMQRVTCHFGTAPFFSFINDGVSNGAFYSCNKVIGVGTVEQVRSGFIKIAGALNFTARDIGFYDSADVDGHMIETATGDGGRGRHCEQCVFENICVVSVSGDVIGVPGTDMPATFTSSGTTVTVTANGHPWKAGQRVYVTGDIAQRATVVDPSLTQLTFVANTMPPASGNLRIYTAAMTIKVGSGDARHAFRAIGGNLTSTVEVDLNNRDCLFIGDHVRVGVYRVAATAKVIGFNRE